MSVRIRRRPDVALTDQREWEAERDFEIGRHVATGLGTRPARFWFYETDRADLAQDCQGDPYSHLREPEHPIHRRAADRLRFLASAGELERAEIAAIRAGTGPRYAWRQAILDEVGL